MGVNVWREYQHNERTRPTTYIPHVPSTTPYALKLLMQPTHQWVFTHPFTPMAPLMGFTAIGGRLQLPFGCTIELEGAVWCVLISGSSLMQLC